jgi:hypothetical protein
LLRQVAKFVRPLRLLMVEDLLCCSCCVIHCELLRRSSCIRPPNLLGSAVVDGGRFSAMLLLRQVVKFVGLLRLLMVEDLLRCSC